MLFIFFTFFCFQLYTNLLTTTAMKFLLVIFLMFFLPIWLTVFYYNRYKKIKEAYDKLCTNIPNQMKILRENEQLKKENEALKAELYKRTKN